MPQPNKKPKSASPGPRPVNPNACPLYRKCGGCQLQNLAYEEQLRFKQNKVKRLLGEFGPVNPILGMKEPYRYRNKVQAAFGLNRRGEIISGVYQSSTHNIIPVDDCMTEDETADRIIVTIRGLLKSFRLSPYQEDTGRGFLRHVLVRRGFQSGQVMVVLVTGTPVFPGKKQFLTALCRTHPEITTVLQNINPGQTSLVLGERELVLFGPGYIEDLLCGCVFRISAKSFYQINPSQTEVLYGKAMEYAALSGSETVIDAYCGIGAIGLIASRRAGRVLGMELNRDAVRDAIANMRRNKITNARFFCADAGEFMTGMAGDSERADVVFMDPPRAGSDRRFLTSVIRLGPKKIVYISCNPETQARDVKFLTRRGYVVRQIQPVDMFPMTNHIETVVLLCRNQGISHE